MSAKARTYAVEVKREGRWWVFEVPELDTAGQAHKLSEVEFEARGIISAWEQVPMESVAVDVTIQTDPELLREWQAAELDEANAREAQARAAAKRRGVVRRLRGQQMSAEEVGLVLRISRQRVYQMEKADKLASKKVDV
ncbi:antitoxin HicB (plasmid) [Frigoribacterium sp. NBH87]|uniref:antitoxin HicB n=1 Tax=Frigoribacterium sp. NBH87 TaxID=2596916 RepID=UPI001627EDB8|nr:antitoxin HicB [Frigoribacterium sp. NBH87]QNE45458.1 antitoxin HicB [Frigoribacterium sp. NBH87]